MNLDELIEAFIDTQDSEKDSWYASYEEIAEIVLIEFKKYLEANGIKLIVEQ